jgi:hypothetical protein
VTDDTPGTRGELIAVLLVATTLVIARSLVYAVYEHADFDSDQAIVGLMAKHLAEGRAFPLFFYGQTFMLGVEAWLMVPVFWVMGPTVAALKTSLVLTNLALVWLLVTGLVRWGGLRPALALVPALFVAFPPPLATAYLVNANGGNIEPLFYAALLWWIRERPFWFGGVLAVGFLNREFAIYGGVVLFVMDAARGRLRRAEGVRHWLFVLLTFVVVWDGIQALRPYGAYLGPGTTGTAGVAFGGEQFANMRDRVSVRVSELPARVSHVVANHLPLLVGGVTVRDGIANQGRDWLGWLLAAVAVIGVLRVSMLIVWARPASPTTGPAASSTVPFAWYIFLVGLAAAAGYVLTRPAGDVMLRYFLVALLLPVGATAVWIALEPRALVRAAIVSVIAVWFAVSAVDHARQWSRYRHGEPNTIREVADAIEARGYRVLEAEYWRAYKLTFLTQERLKVASTDFIRIEEYQWLAHAEGPALRTLSERPCPDGEPVGVEYLCPPIR